MKLTKEDRSKMSSDEFAGKGHTYPINDKNHARLAISGASHAEHVGNISKSEEERIDAKAEEKLHGDSGKGGAEAAKAAVAKMHPEHVHRLVKDAHDGKFGPDAQKAAQQAMQGSAEQRGAMNDDTDQPGPEAKPNYASMFNGNDESEDEDQTAPVPAGSIFSRGR